MEWQQHLPKPIQNSEDYYQKECNSGILQQEEQLYLETKALGISVGASLVQVRDGLQFLRNEVPNNATLRQIAFVNKSLTSAETHYSNIE